MYRSFGQAEVESTLEVSDQLKDLPFIDSDNMAVWGWSYGGYLSLSTLAKERVFKKDVAQLGKLTRSPSVCVCFIGFRMVGNLTMLNPT